MQVEAYWNSLRPNKRLALLNTAGYINYGRAYAYRVWKVIPSGIRADIEYAAQRLGVL